MKTLPLSAAKTKLGELVDEVASSDEEITITKNGRAMAVLVSHGELASLRETLAIKSDPKFMEEIRRGLRAFRGKKVTPYTLTELLGD